MHSVLEYFRVFETNLEFLESQNVALYFSRLFSGPRSPSCRTPVYMEVCFRSPGTSQKLLQKPALRCIRLLSSQSPKAGHIKAGQSDFRSQRLKPDTGKTRKMRKVSLTTEKYGLEEIQRSENAENAGTKTRKMRIAGFNVTGFR